ncbi:putative protein Mb3657 [Talaromyces islandicus]|uniref:Rhodopsin domain-containing protein n=1 Tax=Talaromyces islandicus TaxID=28573 RepID=A0A0U1LJX9_TALIS|nr:putative protein Mb3657 [Talaromyces islandicus]
MGYNLPVELFTELGIGILIFSLRFYARWKTVGPQNFGYDDMFAGIAVVFWILEATFLYTCGAKGNNIGLNETTAMQVPDNQVPILVLGSKLAYAAWVFYILLIWSLKSVLLSLYIRLTMGIWQQKLARIMIGLSIATFLTSLLWHICSCLPPSKSWQVKPYPGNSCTSRPGNYILITIMDVVTDFGILIIPFPMLLEAQLSRRQKISLGFLFSSGIFVMICAVVRAYYSLSNINDLSIALGWASREILVASIVVCAPSFKPILSRAKAAISGNSGSGSGSWKRYGNLTGGRSRQNNTGHQAEGGYLTSVTASGHRFSGENMRGSRFKMASLSRSKNGAETLTSFQGESQERINETTKAPHSPHSSSEDMRNGIHVTTQGIGKVPILFKKMPSSSDHTYSTIVAEVGAYKRNVRELKIKDARIKYFIEEVNTNGYVVIRNAFDKADIDQAKAELELLVNSGNGGPAGTNGRNSFEGLRTSRIYALLDKSRIFDKFITHPDVLALNDYFLNPGYLINAFHSVTIQPGEKPQTMHHDDGHITMPRPHEPFGTGVIVALDSFTEFNGATAVVPKSHLWDETRWPDSKEACPVVMDSGSMVYFLGTLWHGGGKNSSKMERKALNMQYCQPWIRPFENHIVAVDWNKLDEIPPKVVDMMGYKLGTPFVGNVEGGSPLRAVNRRLKEYRSGIKENPKL